MKPPVSAVIRQAGGAVASSTSLTLEYCGKQQRRGREACITFNAVN